jgi:hypothetical protein
VPTTAEYLALVKLLDFGKVERLVRDYLARVGVDQLVLARAGEKFHVKWREKSWDLDEAGLLRLLFGPQLPEEKDLAAFFPMRLWYWGMDSV